MNNRRRRGKARRQRQRRFPLRGRTQQERHLRLAARRQLHRPPQTDDGVQYVADRTG